MKDDQSDKAKGFMLPPVAKEALKHVAIEAGKEIGDRIRDRMARSKRPFIRWLGRALGGA